MNKFSKRARNSRHNGAVFERYGDQARQAVVDGQSEARLMRHSAIGPEHLLLGLLHDKDGVPAQLLAAGHVGLTDVRTEVRHMHEAVTMPSDIQIPFTPSAARVLREVPGDPQVDGGHLLWVIIRSADGSVRTVLRNLGVDVDAVAAKLINQYGDLTG